MKFTDNFKDGVEKFMKEAGISDGQFLELTLKAVENSVEKVKEAGLSKEASEEDNLSDLDKFILKKAKEASITKNAYIKKQECTQSDGTKGSHVVIDHETDEQLGCFTSKEDAKNFLAHGKSADMTDPSSKGYEGRKALAERFYDGNEFDHSRCVSAIEDEGFTDDPDAYCRSLAKLVGRGHEATRGSREGRQPGE